MSLSTSLRLARAELKGGARGFYVFLICLALGVAAIAAIGTIREALERGLADNGAVLLGGDAQVSLTYRFASPEERAALEARATRLSEIADFRSLAAVGDLRVLTQVKAVDSAYPLTGAVTLEPDMPLAEALEARSGTYGAVMDPQLIARLGLEVGQSFSLGEASFTLRAALTGEPDNVASGFSFGPRTLLYRSALDGSGLLSSGTLFDSSYRLELPAGTDLDALEADLRAALPDSGIRWTDARNAAPQASAFIERLAAFLVLVGFSGLAMGGIGVSIAVGAYLARKTRVIATLRSIGASRTTILTSYAVQIAVMALLGISLGLLLGGGGPLLLGPWLSTLLPVPASFAFYPAPLIEAALYGTLTAAIFTIWPLARSENVRAATLFRESEAGTGGLPALALSDLADRPVYGSGRCRCLVFRQRHTHAIHQLRPRRRSCCSRTRCTWPARARPPATAPRQTPYAPPCIGLHWRSPLRCADHRSLPWPRPRRALNSWPDRWQSASRYHRRSS